MSASAVPALVAVVLLLLVGLLALVAEGRTVAGRWFALANLVLATTAAVSGVLAAAHRDQIARAMLLGRWSYMLAAIAFAAIYMQLSALADESPHATVKRLRRLTLPAVALTLGAGLLSLATDIVLREPTWIENMGFTPGFAPGIAIVFVVLGLAGSWMVALLVAVARHGTPPQRAQAGWMGAGVLFCDFFGLTLLALVLPRFGFPTVIWSPTALALGSMLMLSGMVLTRQRELERRDSLRLPSSPAPAERHPSPARNGEGQRCRSCERCGAVLGQHFASAHCPLDGGAIVAGADPWVGRTVDGSVLVEGLVGVGGMGRVYRGRHLERAQPVALKLLNAELAAALQTAERFTREARSIMRIQSPHVVTVHDQGVVPPGIPYLTMELIAGPSLSTLLAGGRSLTPASVALLGRQLAAGLASAHAQSVLHRDLKPDNVLVAAGAEGEVAKIVDFGLAKIVDDPGAAHDLTTLGRVFGTPAYLSPEQAAGQLTDSRSDVYSLGVVLYRARAGCKPFEGSALELIASHINDAPPPLGDEPIDALVMRLLAKAPAERPSASELGPLFDALTHGATRFELRTVTREPSLFHAVTQAAAARPAMLPAVESDRITTAHSPALAATLPPTATPPQATPSTGRRWLRFANERLAIARCRGVMLSLLHQPLTLDGIEHLREWSREVYGDAANRHGAVSIIEPGAAAAIGPEVRAASTALASEFPMCCAAIVIEGTGFRPATTRTLIAGIFLVSKKSYPHRVFERVEDAAPWVVEMLAAIGVRADADEIVAAAAQARAAIVTPKSA